MDTALLLIRLVVGGIVAAHGAQKLFGWFHGHGLAGTAAFLESLGFRPGRAHAWLLGSAELFGGLALASGFLTPVAAAAVTGTMLAAIVAVHWEKGFFSSDGGYEFPLALGVAGLAMAFSGAGRWSLDRALDWTLGDGAWGIAALAMAAAATVAVLTGRGIRLHRPARTGPTTA